MHGRFAQPRTAVLHSLTGCNSVCPVYNKTKEFRFNHWISHQYKLAARKETIAAHMNTTEQFVVAAFAPMQLQVLRKIAIKLGFRCPVT